MLNSRNVTRLLGRGVALLLLLSVGGLAVAEEEAELSPAQRYRAVVKDLPAPSATLGFDFSGTAYVGEQALGEFRFTAAAAVEEGCRCWKTSDSFRLTMGGVKRDLSEEAVQTSGLAAVKGDSQRDRGDGPENLSWKHTAEGYRITKAAADGAEQVTVVKGGGDALPTVAAQLLFCRLAPLTPAEYDLPVFVPDSSAKRSLRTVRLHMKGTGEWRGQAAFLATLTDGERIVSIAIDPESRKFLGMRMVDPGGMTVEMRPGPATAAGPEVSFAPPANDPKTAALIIALAYGTGNGALLVRMTDWPSVVADLERRHPGKKFDEARLAATVGARLDAYSNKKEREVVLVGIRAFLPQIQVEMAGDDRATVRFPKAFKSLVLEVARFGEEWLLVVIPGT